MVFDSTAEGEGNRLECETNRFGRGDKEAACKCACNEVKEKASNFVQSISVRCGLS